MVKMVKRVKIQEIFDKEYKEKDDFEDYIEDNNLIKNYINDLSSTKVVESFPGPHNFSDFKSQFFPADELLSNKIYSGKLVSRKSFHDDDGDEDGKSDVSSETNYDRDDNIDEENESSINEDYDEDDDDDDDKEEYNISGNINEDESEIDNDLSETEQTYDSSFLYSKQSKDISSDIVKGNAIRNQSKLWENLLEGRIKLQKCLTIANRLPQYNKFSEFATTQLSMDDDTPVVNHLQDTTKDLLDELLKLQMIVRNSSDNYLKRKKEQNDEEEEVCLPLKRRKLEDYSEALEKIFNNYVPYRNMVIQTWNDKTKVSTGKLAKFNFSAFDQPTVKQIEQILKDKQRLVRRTQTKRSHYKIIGNDNMETQEKKQTPEEVNQEKDENFDPEIFDDDDFYHKLLRDYIEKKTADVTDPTQLSRKWIELQKLRIKMKRKVDTRSTKGRKLRYNVHSKLVNFMAPITDTAWNSPANNELYKSLFDK